jgi:hypothetical protein
MFRVVGVRADGEAVIIFEQSTRHAAEIVLRLIQYASPFAELHIEGGPGGEGDGDGRAAEERT